MKKRFAGMVVGLLLSGCGGFTQVSIDPEGRFPKRAGGVEVLALDVKDQGPLKVAHVHLRNPGDTIVVWMNANWYDAQGVYVETPNPTQQEVHLAWGEEKNVTFTAPTPEAKIPRVQIRKGRK